MRSNHSILKENHPEYSFEGLCWSWNSNTLVTWCEELTHWKRPWCWERLKEGGEGDDRGWDGWMASPTQWTWVWVNSGRWWWTGRPGVLQSMGSQRVTEWLNWLISFIVYTCFYFHSSHPPPPQPLFDLVWIFSIDCLQVINLALHSVVLFTYCIFSSQILLCVDMNTLVKLHIF